MSEPKTTLNPPRHQAPRKSHYGDPFAEQRALESGRVIGLDSPIGQWAYDAVRIAHGIPDTDREPNVAPDQRLVFLHLDGVEQVLPEAGALVLDMGSPTSDRHIVGEITSAAWHYELGAIALAIVDKAVRLTAPLVVEFFPEGAVVRAAASQTAIAEIAANP